MEFCSVFNTRSGRTLASFARIALTPEAVKRGLLDCSRLEAGEGMLLPSAAIHTVGMRFTIDVVFVGSAGKVLRCGPVSPGKQFLCPYAAMALELPGGTIEATDTREGDVLSFDYF